MNAKTIPSEKLWSLASYLRTASARFQEFADLANVPSANPRLVEQFQKQRKEAEEFAAIFENAEFVEVVSEEHSGTIVSDLMQIVDKAGKQ